MIAGVLSDTAMIRYNRFPTVSFEERKKMLEQIPEVDEVVVQDEVMYGFDFRKNKTGLCYTWR